MTKRVQLNIEKYIAHVELQRGAKMNALDDVMFDELLVVGEQIKTDSSIRVVVLSGQGGNFCGGLDISLFNNVVHEKDLEVNKESSVKTLTQRTHGIFNKVQAVVWQWRELQVPVIAAIEGVAFGGGFQIALGADMRYASPNSQFSIMEIKWGIIPDMGGTQLMRHLANEDIVRELTYTGRIFSAQKAKDYRFVTDLHEDPKAHALEIAANICRRNPDAIKACKEILNQAAYTDLQQGLLRESQLQDKIIGSSNQIEAAMAVIEKREPSFK